MEEKDFKKFIVPFIILVLAIPSFFILKPIFIWVVLGLIFAYIMNPLYTKLNKRVKSKYLSASIILVLTIFIIIIPLAMLVPTTTKQMLGVYSSITHFDIAPILNNVAPFIADNPAASVEIQAASSQIKSALSSWLLGFLKDTIMAIPEITLGIVILLFTFFFSLIESERFRDYFSIMFPFPKEYREKFYERFTRITDSVLYGQFIIGVVQGVVAGVGYFILGVPGAFLLTLLTIIVGVLPVVGPVVIWAPVDVYLFATGHTGIAIALLIYGLFVISWVDTFLRPKIIASRAEMNSAIALIGTIGGLYAFGIVGIVIGPLVLGYLILLIEIYKDKDKTTSIVIKEEKPAEIKSAT